MVKPDLAVTSSWTPPRTSDVESVRDEFESDFLEGRKDEKIRLVYKSKFPRKKNPKIFVSARVR